MKKLLTIVLALILLSTPMTHAISTEQTINTETIHTRELFKFINVFKDHNDNKVYIYLQSIENNSGYVVETNFLESDIKEHNAKLKGATYILYLNEYDEIIEMYFYSK